jgi:hypothetical protein
MARVRSRPPEAIKPSKRQATLCESTAALAVLAFHPQKKSHDRQTSPSCSCPFFGQNREIEGKTLIISRLTSLGAFVHPFVMTSFCQRPSAAHAAYAVSSRNDGLLVETRALSLGRTFRA